MPRYNNNYGPSYSARQPYFFSAAQPDDDDCYLSLTTLSRFSIAPPCSTGARSTPDWYLKYTAIMLPLGHTWAE